MSKEEKEKKKRGSRGTQKEQNMESSEDKLMEIADEARGGMRRKDQTRSYKIRREACWGTVPWESTKCTVQGAEAKFTLQY